MNWAIAGGCFTQQGNIAPEQLYYQHILKELTQFKQPSIVRYERHELLLEKLEKHFQSNPFSILLLHLRAEPLMKRTKLIFHYSVKDAKKRTFIHHPWNHKAAQKRFLLPDSIMSDAITHDHQPPKFTTLLQELNNGLGKWLGHQHATLLQLEQSVTAIAKFCKINQIQFIVTGAVARPISKSESAFARKMDAHFQAWAKKHNVEFISLLHILMPASKALFFPAGIHVSTDGHEVIGKIIKERIQPYNISHSL